MTRTTRSAIIGMAAILVAGLSLRIPTISLGPLLPDLRSSTGYGETLLSLLTSIPLALTLVIAPMSPWLARRFGRNRIIIVALTTVTVGIVVRSLPHDVALFSGTVLLGVGIATGTVLIPAAIASATPVLRARLTGTYSMSLSLGPALALGLTVPIMRWTDLDWTGTLAVWAGCSLIAVVLWAIYARDRYRNPTPQTDSSPVPPQGVHRVLRDPSVWQIALYLGITSITFYATSTWLPTTLMMGGVSTAAAGSYTAIINIVAIPCAFLAPAIMSRGYAQWLAPLAPIGALIAVALLLTVGPSGVVMTVLLFGISQGLCLGVSYDQVVRYARSPDHAAAISAVTSASGVALAALGPLAYGFGLEVTASATASLTGLGAVVACQILLGLRTGRVVREPRL
ncbi:MFS transporter [Enteractinococcus fodinae]|uniref:CP family cyanate transporter-like MFS transporter n=1 Tax=Enteractinococcus fodinae TaxID=684663 RepID=A0ABU2B3T7_9MICC|nr:MFS transporter [Enteractinococcus fodinae]MDR7348276.1 CP family cyanate transporter-like MFS transporter [Enteractinococcus fodinae]